MEEYNGSVERKYSFQLRRTPQFVRGMLHLIHEIDVSDSLNYYVQVSAKSIPFIL